MNVKRVHRIWQQERLCVPIRRRHRCRSDRVVLHPLSASRPNQVWTYDVVHDPCANGQRVKMLTLTDEFTRESLALEGATTIRAPCVVTVLEQVFRRYGTPAYLRSVNVVA